MNKMKRAIITGITGQDGLYLSKLLIEKGYEIVGIVRSINSINNEKLNYLKINDKITFIECDLTDFTNILRVIQQYEPDEIYNLAAQSSVSTSFNQPISTLSFNIISVANILEVIRLVNKNIKFYQASSSEMFGKVKELPIIENSIHHPVSPYAISKSAAHRLVNNYRDSYGIYASCGILFNHESVFRSDNFFIKKVIVQSIEISQGKRDFLTVGNIDVKRDFGYAPKYVEAMWLMMQCAKPDDFIICSGKSMSLRQIIEYVFKKLNISISKLKQDSNFMRPVDIIDIYGDMSKAKKELAWNYNLSENDLLDLLIEEEINFQNYIKKHD